MDTHDSDNTRMAQTLTRFREDHPTGFVRRSLTNALLTHLYRAVSDEDRKSWKPYAIRRSALILQKFRDSGEARFNRDTRRWEWNETGPILRYLEQTAATSCTSPQTNMQTDIIDTRVAC